MRLLGSIALAAAAALTPVAAHAAVVADSLPYPGTPAWSDVIFAGASMTPNGSTSTTMGTSPGNGVWFGWQSGTNTPGWSLGDAATGNYLSLIAALGTGSADWETYLYDGSYGASLVYAPTGCVCYGQPPAAGVDIYFYAANANGYASVFVPLNPSMPHTYELLLKGGQVTYRIDGVAYSGAALASLGAPVLVIGDGSGPTPTVSGSMTVYSVSLDNAPSFSTLATTVPEPGTWAMMIGGFGLAGGMMRRRRNESVAATA